MDPCLTSPLCIIIALACHYSTDPAKEIGTSWNSPAGMSVRDYLKKEGLITLDHETTDRGKAWVKKICNTALPEAWVIEEKT